MAPPRIRDPGPQLPEPIEDEALEFSEDDFSGSSSGSGDRGDNYGLESGSSSSPSDGEMPTLSVSDMPSMVSPHQRGTHREVPPWLSVEGSVASLDFKRVRAEEIWHMHRSWLARRQQVAWERRADRAFSVALSGGGIRAAAFQSGVLWRLAEEGLLADVEFLAAVSGGGYLASALTSQIAAACGPGAAGGLRGDQAASALYRKAVARCICRMQANAGGFVRDTRQADSLAAESSGCLPRWMDLPLLLLALCGSMAFNPITFVVLVVVPVIEIVENFFGSAMRAAFCAAHPPASGYWEDWKYIVLKIEDRSELSTVRHAMYISSLLTFICWVTSKWQQCRMLPTVSKHGRRSRPVVSRRLLVADGARAFLLRFTVILGIFLLVVYAATLAQWWQYVNLIVEDSGARQGWCGEYIRYNGTKTAGFESHRRCSALNADYEPWWTESEFNGYRNCTVWDCSEESIPEPKYAPGVRSIGRLFWHVVLVGLGIAICLWPFITGLLFTFFSVAGQGIAFWLLVLSVQFRVFTPLTGQLLLGTFAIDEVEWYYFVGFSLVLTYLVIPMQSHTGSFWHQYYRRTLRLNYLEGGRDLSLADVQKSPWCPLLLMTATVNDYKSVGDKSKANTDEISFSALHTGSYKLGYYMTPAWRKLAHVTAITAAACLDTITISLTKRTRYRFWSEMLNLSWGDYISFTEGPWRYRRLPCLILYIVYQTLLVIGFQLSRLELSCGFSYGCLVAAMAIGVVVLFLSFFTFMRGLGFLAHDQLLRRFHQVTRYYYLGGSGAVPNGVRGAPGLVYVTDGGVSDCTGIVQLMRRRRRHILLVLAAGDPRSELLVLRTAMEVAVSDKIGSFYDLSDEKRHVTILLEEYRFREDWTYFELGIRYGWRYEGSSALGRLVVVKNRLPRTSQYEEQVCRPLLTEELICGEAETDDDDALSDDDPLSKMREADLGGLGCCDCCHERGLNCGAKFPHLGFSGYLWLTPTVFSSLCRLGHAISEDGIEALKAGLREPGREPR